MIVLGVEPLGEFPVVDREQLCRAKEVSRLYLPDYMLVEYGPRRIPVTQTCHAQRRRVETVRKQLTWGLFTKGVVGQSTRLSTTYTTSMCHRQLTFNLVSLFAFAKKSCLRCSPGLSDCYANYP